MNRLCKKPDDLKKRKKRVINEKILNFKIVNPMTKKELRKEIKQLKEELSDSQNTCKCKQEIIDTKNYRIYRLKEDLQKYMIETYCIKGITSEILSMLLKKNE